MARTKDPAKRAALVEAVTKAVAEGGVAAATVPGVASAAGVGTATFYRHFADLPALLNAAYRAHKTEVLALVPPVPPKPSQEALERLFAEAAGWARRSTVPMRFLVAVGGSTFLDAESDALSVRTDTVIRSYVAAACPPTDDSAARWLVVSSVLSALLDAASRGRGVTARTVRSLARTCWRGVGAA